jgi:peptidoglycan DL-endopeptidase CwlO
MSLDGLVAQVGQALGAARGLFGPAPTGGGWGTTGGLGAGRDAVSAVGGAAAQNWRGSSAPTYVAASSGQVKALDSMIGADEATGPGLTATAGTAAQGRGGMDAVISDTRAGAAALAPSTDTPAGKQQLLERLQHQLDRAKAWRNAAKYGKQR